ncbi:MAG: DUF493 domain-containing protein [Bdellovibrio sp.]|nr:MAG: DUF493 domain-containing protein [Bdellovibrio sp.]
MRGSMLKDEELATLKKLLETQYQWPCRYLFKFIVPHNQVPKVKALFPGEDIQLKASRNGNYVGLTVNIHLESADVVIAIYQKASQIKGLISL